MAGVHETLKLVQGLYERMIASADRAEQEAEKIYKARVEVDQAIARTGGLEERVERADGALGKAIKTETQNFKRWAFFKMGVLAGCVGGLVTVWAFLLHILSLREALELLGLR